MATKRCERPYLRQKSKCKSYTHEQLRDEADDRVIFEHSGLPYPTPLPNPHDPLQLPRHDRSEASTFAFS